MSEKMAVFIVVQATVGLLALYFLLSKVFFVVILVFYTLLSVMAVSAQLSLFLEYLKDEKKERTFIGRFFGLSKSVTLPFFGKCPVSELLSVAVGLAVGVTWSCIRLTSWWAWVLQDISGICIILTILMFLKLPNLKVASILLPLIMFYDVFFVYIQPLLFHNESVMKKVATGGDTHEILPMALIFPNFENPQAFSMLGYGDIALPGLLLMYAAGFDECHRIRWIDSYFFVEIVGYVCGLVLTIAALALDIGGQGGQPALLYLVPCTLIPIIFTSLYRGDFGAMFHANLIFLQSPNTEGGARGGDSSSNRLAHGSIKNDEGQEHELLLAS